MATKSILITGCSSGIGLCVAHGLHNRGYQVFATARKSADVEKLKETGLQAVRLDLQDPISIRDAVEKVVNHTGGTLDALFNNAAYGQWGAVEDLSRAVLREQFETNLFGTQELTNLVLPIMRRQGYGRIIQTSSVLGMVSMPYRGAYNATKFALEALSDALRLELKDTAIHVSLIEPGPIVSHFRENAYAAYQRNIQKQNSAHKNVYTVLEQRLTATGPVTPFTLGPEAVLKKVIHALESPKPHIRYYVTVHTHLLAVLRRILPYKVLDWLLLKRSMG
jgi:NAD(P)-dependent dehydrogenase (short-subunit alcohol dehydrogenase family)